MNSHLTLKHELVQVHVEQEATRFDYSVSETLIQLFNERKPWNIRNKFRKDERFEMPPFRNTHILRVNLSVLSLQSRPP